MLHKAIRLAEIFNIVEVIPNQVQAAPDTFFRDPTEAAGGNVVAHSTLACADYFCNKCYY